MESIFSLTPKKAAAILKDKNLRSEGAANIFKDIYREKAESTEEMNNTSAAIKALLRDNYDFTFPLEAVDIREDTDTTKYLFRLCDGGYIETVVMRQKYGSSICISTQNGCNMGCAFCVSGKYKKQRNLTTAEMTAQVMYASRRDRISNITVMGIGEPFDNYDALCDFLELMTYPFAFGIGECHITVSTCGIAPRIYDFASRENPVLLAVSLHAPNNELRNKLMPINKAYPIEEVIKAAEFYSVKCNRRVLLEYILLDGVNDSVTNARELSELIGDKRLFVNLIPYNKGDIGSFTRSSPNNIAAFYDVLKKHGIGVTMRREFGADLDAACGQLRSDRI